MLEENRHRKVASKALLDTRHHAYRQNRVPSQLKEVVHNTNRAYTQQLRPYIAQLIFHSITELDEPGRFAIGLYESQGTSINLAIRRQGEALHPYYLAGDHILRQPPLQFLAH